MSIGVYKDSVIACILDEQGKKIFEKCYGTLIPDLAKLRDDLVDIGCGCVAMESTSIYWTPIWHVLYGDFSLTLANPYFIKQLPGRKSDVKDAQWIAECLQKKLIKSSLCCIWRVAADAAVYPSASSTDQKRLKDKETHCICEFSKRRGRF